MKKYIFLATFFALTAPCLAGAVTPTATATVAPVPTLYQTTTAVHSSLATPSMNSGQVFSTTLQKGASGSDVSTLQTMLKTSPAIYPSGLVTGYYGSATETAIKKLQAKYSLPQTGIVDSATQAIMYPNPSTTNVSITVIAPNGGEKWTAGSPAQILWKSTISPIALPPTPTPIPVPMMDNQTSAISASVVGSSGAVSAGTSIAKTAPAIMPTPFFNYASIDLVRDGDSSYSYHIGSVNLYESQYSWNIPKNIPTASDYRVKISIGNTVPCMYANDVQMMKAGTANTTAIARPTCATPMIASSFASDTSDAVFSIAGGSSVNIETLRAQIAEIKAMMEKLSAQIADIEAKLEGM